MTGIEICNILKDAGVDSYAFDTRVLCEEICGRYSDEHNYESKELFAAVKKRAEGYPLQYILGKWWFWDCEFDLSADCLIPRADTEIIVERAIKILPRDAEFADLCAGSGCIGVSILHTRKDTFCDAYELYPKTLQIAQHNAKKNGVEKRYNGILGDVLKTDTLGDKKYHAIISNPPYIRSHIVPTLSREVGYEPKAALDGGLDGLIFYRAIIDNFYNNLYDGGIFIFEIGYDQAVDLISIANQRNLKIEVIKDLSKNDRCVIIYK